MAEDGAPVDLEIQAPDFRRLLQDMRHLENAKPLKRQLGQAMRAAGKPMLKQVRQNVRQVPSGRSYGKSKKKEQGNLRRNIAKAATIQVRTGARGAGLVVRINPRKMPDGPTARGTQRNLPAYLDGQISHSFATWRHPVFGSKDHWVTQKQHPYFLKAIEQHRGQALREVADAMEKIRRELAT